MDRIITNVSESIYEWMFSKPDQNKMTALGKLAGAMFGTSTIVNGLSCVPTGPASLQVVINPGEIYSLVNLESSICGTLPVDSTHQIVKQGILLDAFTSAAGALNPPGSAGQSINYLIEAQYADSDVSIDPTTGNTPVVLQFYNSSNPSQPFSGPGGGGATSTTFRKGIVSLQIKAGVAATTGSQVTPTPDAGWVGLWVVTVANGQSTIVAGNITQYAGAPILPSSLLASIQSGNLSYAVGTGTANAHVAAFTPPITARVDGMVLRYKAPAANTGALTFNDGLGAVAVVGAAHSALQGGETAANGDVWLQWNSSIGGGSYVMLDSTGGAAQVGTATQPQHAVPMAQAAGVVGGVRNLVMSVTAASATATLTADEIIVETALGGTRFCLPSFNKTINLATTGAGGMDTGSAPASGYVALYAIYNPTTQTAALLAQNAATLKPNVYGGANMPAGYTASALLTVVPTNASGQIKVVNVLDRVVYFPAVTVLNASVLNASLTSLNVSAAIPANAVETAVSVQFVTTVAATLSYAISGSSLGVGGGSGTGGSVVQIGGAISRIPVITSQTIYYSDAASAGTVTLQISVPYYSI